MDKLHELEELHFQELICLAELEESKARQRVFELKYQRANFLYQAELQAQAKLKDPQC